MDFQPLIEPNDLARWSVELLVFGLLGFVGARRWRLAPWAALGAIASVAVRCVPQVLRSPEPRIVWVLCVCGAGALTLVALGFRRRSMRPAI